jgi:hypothetical protein
VTAEHRRQRRERRRQRRISVLAVTAIVAIVAATIVYWRTRSPASTPARIAPFVRHQGRDSTTTKTAAASTTIPALDDPLGAKVFAYLATRVSTVQADVYDLATGQSWTVGSGGSQAEASVVKLNVLEVLMAQNQLGLSDQDTSLAQSMMENSDNDAATSLWNTVGGASGVRSFNSRVGLSSTTPSPCVDCPGFAWPGWGLTMTSAVDQILLLRQIVQPNRFLNDSQRNFALQLMENVTPSESWGVSGGVAPGTTIALKNGWLPLNDAATDWQINSVGWVSGSGRNYLVAVLTTGNPTEQYGIDTIDGLSSLVWQSMPSK